MVKFTKSLFFSPRDKTLARKISIRTPTEFKKSIRAVSVGGVSIKEKRALRLAKVRARVQLRRKNLSIKERKQFSTISKMKLPKVSRK